MKLLLAITLLSIAGSSLAAPRAKRGLGGAPCVVTGNSLYINGLYQRNLTSSEQSELSQYQNQLTQYENAVQAAIDQRKQNRQNGNRNNNNNNNNASSMPQPPDRPSFCSDDAITQYIFDGCMVQDDKVYVGKQYARNLSQSEIQQLQDFDSQMEAYQQYLQQQLQNQVNSLFGPGFLSQFNNNNNGGSTTMPTTTGATSSPGPAPQPPTAPNFCTAIY